MVNCLIWRWLIAGYENFWEIWKKNVKSIIVYYIRIIVKTESIDFLLKLYLYEISVFYRYINEKFGMNNKLERGPALSIRFISIFLQRRSSLLQCQNEKRP